MSFSYGNWTLWLIYIIIGDWDLKTRRSQTQLSTLLLDSTFVVYKLSKNRDNKDKDLKAKIYDLVLKTML